MGYGVWGMGYGLGWAGDGAQGMGYGQETWEGQAVLESGEMKLAKGLLSMYRDRGIAMGLNAISIPY